MGSSYPNVNILVVDDNIGMRSILVAVVRAIGFPSIRTADTGDQALRMIPEVKPDLIITDLRMPLMDGIQFVRTLRADASNPYSTVPIIVATGHTEDRHVRACLAAGVDQFLAKPVTGQKMADRIMRIINEEREFVRTADYVGPRRPDSVMQALASQGLS